MQMKFVLSANSEYLLGKSWQEISKILVEFAWKYRIQTNNAKDGNTWCVEDIRCVEISKPGCVEWLAFSELGKCESNIVVSTMGFFASPKFISLREVSGTPGCMSIQSQPHTILRLNDGRVLYDWADFYNFMPFSEIIKIKSRNVVFRREFVEAGMIKCKTEMIPLPIWRKYTKRLYKDVCKLHPNLKFNCIYVQTIEYALERLKSRMGLISQVMPGTFVVEDTSEIFTLQIGDVMLYNQDLVLHVPSVETFCGFEMIGG